MAKGKQLVVRIDNDLGKLLEETAAKLNRSQAAVLCAALHALSKLSMDERRRLLIEYLTRDVGAAPPATPAPPKSEPPRRGPRR